jgi:hypothetical protein
MITTADCCYQLPMAVLSTAVTSESQRLCNPGRSVGKGTGRSKRSASGQDRAGQGHGSVGLGASEEVSIGKISSPPAQRPQPQRHDCNHVQRRDQPAAARPARGLGWREGLQAHRFHQQDQRPQDRARRPSLPGLRPPCTCCTPQMLRRTHR